MNRTSQPLAVSAALLALLLHLLLSLLPLPSLYTVPIAALLPLVLSRMLLGRAPMEKDARKNVRLFFCLLPVLIFFAMLLSRLAGNTSSLPSAHPALIFLYYVILPAVFEELFYRHTLLYLLLPLSRIASVLVSALFFAALHAPSAMPYAFVSGLLLGYAYLEGGSILLPIALHFANNTLSFLFVCIEGADAFFIPLLILFFLLGIPAVYILLRYKNLIKAKGKCREKL